MKRSHTEETYLPGKYELLVRNRPRRRASQHHGSSLSQVSSTKLAQLSRRNGSKRSCRNIFVSLVFYTLLSVFQNFLVFPPHSSGLFWGKTCLKKVKALLSKVQWSVKRLDLLEKPLLEGVIIYWKKRYFLWWSSSWEITRYLYKKCCHVKPVLLPEVETNILFRQKTSLNTCQYFVVFPS